MIALSALCLHMALLQVNLPAQQSSSSPNYKLVQQPNPGTSGIALPQVVANVNGVEISINQFWRRILNNAGNAVLTALVDEILLEQEIQKKFGIDDKKKSSKRKKGTVMDKIESEVNQRFSNLKSQFQDEQTFQQQLRNSGMQVDDIHKQIRMDLYKEKLLETLKNSLRQI